jgi:MoaA/NifB/PqqE/SkfB family radical SAM enzyme
MLEHSFCSSPWFSLRLTYNGDFEECRWIKKSQVTPINVRNTSLLEFYNSDRMCNFRTELLNGVHPAGCETCRYEDSFDKLNGRRRQLLKSGIRKDAFALSLRSSPHYQHFLHTWQNNGHADYAPVDLQIDLGNVCNSACIMCVPTASSRLHTEYRTKLHKINSTLFADPVPYQSWTEDPATLEKFIVELLSIPDIKYIHFLGGETLYDPAFYTICERLIDAGVSQNIIVGTTTNGTIYDTRVERLISQFKEFHLGISIESVTELNDYIRYPGKIAEILPNMDRFLALRDSAPLFVSLRITPNVFTASEIDLVFRYMLSRRVIAESCNILFDPPSLRMEVMPDNIRQNTISKLQALINEFGLVNRNHVNIRKNETIDGVIADTVVDYYNFIKEYQLPDNVEELRYQLVSFIKTFELSRNNCILDYAPEYEQFLRHYGY